MSSRKLTGVIEKDKAPGFLFAEGFYRYSVLSTSLDATNHHLNLLAQRFCSFASESSPRALTRSGCVSIALDHLRANSASALTLSSVVLHVIPVIATD